MLRTTTGAPSEADPALSILVIEQGQAMAEAHRARLERDGYSVEHAFGGPAALERATERPPDLIFPALRLPGILDSAAVLESLRQDVRTRSGGRRSCPPTPGSVAGRCRPDLQAT